LTDTIQLTIPANAHFRPVATLVLGGIGSRLELPYETIDDLQLAVLSALVAAEHEVVNVAVEIEETDVTVSVGPLVDGSGVDDALRLVLDRLVDSVEATARADGEWLTLTVGLLRSGPSEGATSSPRPAGSDTGLL
jgi:hypothetical protein